MHAMNAIYMQCGAVRCGAVRCGAVDLHDVCNL